jgi:hypothetical protein
VSTLAALFTELEADGRHQWRRAADPAAIDQYALGRQYALPDDLRAFFRRYDHVRLFVSNPTDWVYAFGPITALHPTWQDVFGPTAGPNDQLAPDWLSVCDCGDGNFLALDLASGPDPVRNYIACDHKVFARPGYEPIVAQSFTELLERMLHEDGQTRFWHTDGFVRYGDARPLTIANAAFRVDGDDQPGWTVSFRFNGIPHREIFNDRDYGDAKASFAAANTYFNSVVHAQA